MIGVDSKLRTLYARAWFRYLLLLGWMGFIFWLSAQPDLRAVPLAQRFNLLPKLLGQEWLNLLEWILRKAAHMVAFGLLALFAKASFRASHSRAGLAKINIAAFFFAVLYAMTDEWHQSFVPTRVGSPVDVLIDSAGAVLAFLITWPRSVRQEGVL